MSEMDFEIDVNGETKKVVVEEPRGKHQKAWWAVFQKVMETPDKASEFMALRDNILKELSGLTDRDIDEIRIVDKDRMLDFVEGRITMRGERPFLPSSKKPQQ